MTSCCSRRPSPSRTICAVLCCDGSAASAVSDCVASSHAPDGKAPPASSVRCRVHHADLEAETTIAWCDHYGGRPAADQASAMGSASAGGSPMAAQNLAALKEGSNASTCSATACASSMRPSLASAAASRLWDTLKLGTDCRARRAACAASS